MGQNVSALEDDISHPRLGGHILIKFKGNRSGPEVLLASQ